MEQTIEVNWKRNMLFETQINGHQLIMDVAKAQGGDDEGMRPKPLMMAALAGCTGIDVVSILKKMRVGYDNFKITITAQLTETEPKYYTGMHIIYEFYGKDLPYEKIERAVKLSQEQYCGVSHMYRNFMKITYEIIIK